VGEFMSRHVLTVYSSSSVRKAIGVMGDKNVGSLVVLDNSGPAGVFTERDLLSKVLAKGKDRDNTLVMEVLSPLFVSIESTATLPEAARLMIDRKSRLMVFEGGGLEGIVTATDLVRCIAGLGGSFGLNGVVTRKIVMELPETPLITVVEDMDRKRIGSVLVGETQEKAYGIFTERDLLVKVLLKRLSLEFLVGELATVPLMTAKLGIDGVEAARLMVAKRIKRLPLTLNGQVAGMVTARDVVEAFASAHPA
jgi:signal-transduction protein with cAMP-binding, CBS, and nucleotidyltransferase domain